MSEIKEAELIIGAGDVSADSNNKATIVFSATNIDLFQLCEARYNMKTNLNKTLPIIQKAKALDRGGLMHEGLEVYYNGLKEEKHFDDRMQSCLMKIRELSADPEISNSEPEDVNFLLKVIEENLDYWRPEDEQLIIKAVEVPFDYVLFEDDDVRIIISGKIDLLVDIPAIGRGAEYFNLPFDHKTYEREFPTYRLSNQFLNYCAATGSNYIIINKIGMQKTLKAEDKYKRLPLSYDPIIIEEWKENTIKVILGQYLRCVSEESWTMNFTSCYKFNRLCEFYEVCDSSGREAKKFKLENNFEEAKPWNKYKKED